MKEKETMSTETGVRGFFRIDPWQQTGALVAPKGSSNGEDIS